MNIYKLITPVNKLNYVNVPIIKNNQDYNYQHSDNATSTTRKLSVLTKGKKYSDKYLRPKINVIANFMQLEQKTIPAINKRVPEIVQNNSMYFSDPNTKYDELLTATPAMLATVEPYNYFGCRIVSNYLYNFDYGLIFQIIPHSLLINYIPPEQIKESFVYVDKNKTMAMNDKGIYKNIWMDTKTYRPIHPNYVEYINLRNVENIDLSYQPDNLNSVTATNNTYQDSGTESPTVSRPDNSDNTPVQQPIEPVNTEDSVTKEEYKGPYIDVSDEYVKIEPDESFNTVLPQLEIPPFEQPVIDSDNSILDQQQQQRKRRILNESLNEQQQQQPIRRRRKPKMNETTKKNDKI